MTIHLGYTNPSPSRRGEKFCIVLKEVVKYLLSCAEVVSQMLQSGDKVSRSQSKISQDSLRVSRVGTLSKRFMEEMLR